MLHEFDGYDERWEAEILNSHYDEDEKNCLTVMRRRQIETIENRIDHSSIGRLMTNVNDIAFANNLDNQTAIEKSNEHSDLQEKLVKHLHYQYVSGKLKWISI